MTMCSLNEVLEDVTNDNNPIPFWSWNDKLSVEETIWQINEFKKVGMGGFFMHARGGLETEYMSEEWMQNIKAGIEQAKKLNMTAWGYDENGWPSGFGNGKVNGMGEEYCQKFLRAAPLSENVDAVISTGVVNGNAYSFYYETNLLYVDTLNKKGTEYFCKTTHNEYKKRLGADFASMSGFFTDEPQISRNGVPWSNTLPAAYEKKYNEKLEPLLADLFFQTETCYRTRIRFYSLVRDMFAENYFKVIYDWCEENNVRLTGHVANEDSPLIQLTSNGACMAMYEYFHVPGMDSLTRKLVPSLIPVQLASVCHQLGKKQIISEAFALSGWNISMEDMRWIYEHQMVRGVTLLCPHLSAYSLRGIRKRDYPASISYQQPWWRQFSRFCNYVGFIGKLLQAGKVDYNVLVYHPQSSVWAHFDNSENCGAEIFEKRLDYVMEQLETAQISYHLSDERILSRYALVNNDKLKVGGQCYDTVILPGVENISAEALHLLVKFKNSGGKIICAWEKPRFVDGEKSDLLLQTFPDTACENKLSEVIGSIKRPLNIKCGEGMKGIYSTQRYFNDCIVHYIVNSSYEKKELKITGEGKCAQLINPETGERFNLACECDGESFKLNLSIEARGSVLFAAYPTNCDTLSEPDATSLPICLNDENWSAELVNDNILTLDHCDCTFNGKLFGENIPVNNVQEAACEFLKAVETELCFKFYVSQKPDEEIFLILETPERFNIYVNGVNYDSSAVSDWFCDKCFKKINISRSVICGENIVRLKINFEQRKSVYLQIEDAKKCESEKNKLSYDDEIEAIYICGRFAVNTIGTWEKGEKGADSFSGRFEISSMAQTVNSYHLQRQGLPFFTGTVILKKEIVLTKEEIANRSILLSGLPSTAAAIKVNGREADSILWAPYKVECKDLLREGFNTIEAVIYVSPRNMLGPHHLKEGESHVVVPGSFFESSPLWCNGKNINWDNSYCFVDISLPVNFKN